MIKTFIFSISFSRPKRYCFNKIDSSQKQLNIQNSDKKYSKKQEQFDNQMLKLIEYQKSREEEDRNYNCEIQKKLLEKSKKNELENKKFLENFMHQMQQLEKQRTDQYLKDVERRVKLEQEKERQFRQMMFEEHRKKEEYFEKMLSQIK